MDRVDPRLIEAALAGRETGEPALDRAARVVADLRRVLLEEPTHEAASGHLDAMVSAASDGAGSTPVLSRRRERRRRRFASLPLAAALLLGAGLAWGAVGLPPPDTADAEVDAAQEPAGVKRAKPVAATEQDGTHGDEVSAVAHDDSLQGCEKGQAVSAVASANGSRQGPGHDPCAKGDGGKANGEQASAKGRQTAEEARSKAKDTARAAAGGGPPDSAGGGPPESAGPPSGSPGGGSGGGQP